MCLVQQLLQQHQAHLHKPHQYQLQNLNLFWALSHFMI